MAENAENYCFTVSGSYLHLLLLRSVVAITHSALSLFQGRRRTVRGYKAIGYSSFSTSSSKDRSQFTAQFCGKVIPYLIIFTGVERNL